MTERRIPFASHWSVTPIGRVLRPMQHFIHQSASGGIVLIVATVIALILANTPLSALYEQVRESYIGVSVGPWELRENVLHWINDGLMAVFFFVVGLEIKREVMVGELASRRAATLPIVAAIGGVAVPALIYAAFNFGGAGAAGWGVPMATDIAFALGIMALLGDRVPFPLKIFLTAVAIVDDLIAVLVIAFFYSGGINVTALAVGILFLGFLMLANINGIRSTLFYAFGGIIIWVAFLQSGVHATIAGVLIALTIPARYRIDAPTFLERTHRILKRFEQATTEPDATPMLTVETQQTAVISLEKACEDVQAPLQKLEHNLHPWVAFAIMPIFALANAGVALSPEGLDGDTISVALGIFLGLVVGKPLGVLGAAWLAVRSGIASLPIGVTWQHMAGAGTLAGIGFTMSLFIAALGFGEGSEFLDTAKLAILAASIVAGFLGLILLHRATRGQPLTD
ncbi:MAG TPA: Na+/H+ antiporter NhaA [Ardenticatenaceae bacterium]